MHALSQAPGLALLDMTLRQVGASDRVNLALFLDVYTPKAHPKNSWNFHVNLTLIELCLLKEENTPIAMSTNSFPQIVNFISVGTVISGIL
jgi:hypothetical protein